MSAYLVIYSGYLQPIAYFEIDEKRHDAFIEFLNRRLKQTWQWRIFYLEA